MGTATEQARLSLDGSHLPIVARIERHSDTELVVGRSLPFLRLGTRVHAADGRTGAISRVSLTVSDGVPHLSVELDYDPVVTDVPPPPAAKDRRDPTLGYETRANRASIAPPAPRRDETNHDSTLDLALAETSPRGFVPSLHPMPLPIEEKAPAHRTPRPAWGRRLITFLATLSTLLFAWARPSALG